MINILRINSIVIVVVETTDPPYSIKSADDIFTALSDIKL